MNIAILRGVLSVEPTITHLPNGSIVHNFEMKTASGDEHHTVPVAWHDPTRPPSLCTGDEVVVQGLVRRRWFRAGGASLSRTEVVAACVARAGSKRAAKALESATRSIAESGPFE